MDLSVPCSVEGRSELRNDSRVNCKTHWLIFELWNTLLTERIYRIAEFHIAQQCLQRAWLRVHFSSFKIVYLWADSYYTDIAV